MALPVLDGNQSATTLSSVVTGGEHIVAHTVVSLGSTAISNITSAVSGSVVSVSNFPSSQATTFGAITGSVSVLNFPSSQAVTFTTAPVTFGQASVTFGQAVVSASNIGDILSGVGTDNTADVTTKFFKIGGHQDGSNQISHIVHVSAGGAMKVDATDSVVSISNFPATQTIAGTVTANIPTSSNIGIGFRDVNGDLVNVDNVGTNLPVIVYNSSGESAVGSDGSGQLTGGIAIGHNSGGQFNIVGENSPLPIAGTVTANVFGRAVVDSAEPQFWPIPVIGYDEGIENANRGVVVPVQLTNTNGSILNEVPISGTVTANSLPDFYDESNDRYLSRNATFVEIGTDEFMPVGINHNMPISGTVTVGNSVTIGSLPAISGTVTANVSSTTVTVSSFPRPTWTDYSGTVVTANSAVTAVSTITRSYLLAQVTTGQMFLNIGATCTTGNGVYFSAGQGFAWETSVPQGIVSIISSVTGTNYVLKDG